MRVASNWGQHITLARNGAKTSQQSIAATLIKLSAVVKFKVQSPDNFGIVVLVNGAKGEGARGRKGCGEPRGEGLGNIVPTWLSSLTGP